MIFQNGLYDIFVNSNKIPTDGWEACALMIGFILISAIASYLLGSINSAIIVSGMLYKEDIRTHGSGNAGLTNMLRTYGKGAALLTLVGDMLKTAVAIYLTAALLGISYDCGISLGSGYCYMAGLFAVLGHVYPIFYGFKGGKGVLVTATMALILTPVPFAILITLFIIIVAISGFVSLGSCCVASLFPVAVFLYAHFVAEGDLPVLALVCTIILAIFIVWCHRANIKRIANGTERKISIGGKKSK